MGEKKILTDEAIDRKLDDLAPRYINYIDPMKMAQWTLERACAMVDDAVSAQTVMRAIDDAKLEAYRVGAKVTVEPAKFLLWYKSYRREAKR